MVALFSGAKSREVQAENRFAGHQLRRQPLDQRRRGGHVVASARRRRGERRRQNEKTLSVGDVSSDARRQ